jgi:hypothetical protein
MTATRARSSSQGGDVQAGSSGSVACYGRCASFLSMMTTHPADFYVICIHWQSRNPGASGTILCQPEGVLRELQRAKPS